jgi:predicted nucleic acid-binding protein
LISAWSRFEVIDNTEALPKAGLTFRASAQLSLWDALIAAAAVGAGCEELIIAGVRIINPFLRGAA